MSRLPFPIQFYLSCCYQIPSLVRSWHLRSKLLYHTLLHRPLPRTSNLRIKEATPHREDRLQEDNTRHCWSQPCPKPSRKWAAPLKNPRNFPEGPANLTLSQTRKQKKKRQRKEGKTEAACVVGTLCNTSPKVPPPLDNPRHDAAF